MNLNDLYKKVSAIPIGDFPPSALSGLLHGYISVYSIVRVSPWLEDVYGSQWDIHERIREIAGELADLIKDPDVALEDRVGYVADLMEAYLTYSDMDFLDIALDAAYGIISPEGNGEIVLPCRTPEMCRLLCSCYYFTREKECVELAKSIIKEWGNEQNFKVLALWRIVRAIEFYNNVTDIEEKIDSRMELFEELFSRENSDKFEDVVLYFEILSVKSYEEI
ncbi:hypothetical protein DWW18_08505 [Butyricimonas virosa]|jgi:hypothetical protein|uniref:Uncharacterized protein n=2 Tax=Butyricimonas virosa TaxID=544645 RepID=A0A412X1Q9_9BACT|nr:hypothetical protein [Butyricimonas virosa]RGV34345.1 hypothetical protein DWW18_08505 [Butyricimonas virosa]